MAEPANDRVAEESESWETHAIDTPPADAPGWASVDDDWDFEIEGPAPRERLPAIALALLALGWVGAVGWASAGEFVASAPTIAEIASWIAIASAPLALIGVAWLLLRRTSRREALRFGRTAEAMRNEAKRLDFAMQRIHERLAETRSLLADECDRLFALGDEAAGRLESIGGDVRDAAAMIEDKSTVLDRASRSARDDMDVLLTEMPKAEQAARAVSDGLRTAGVAAHEQAALLETQLAALRDRGREADEVAGGAAQRLAAQLTRIEGVAEVSARRFDETGAHISGAVDEVLARASEAVEEARLSVDQIGQSMLGAVGDARGAIDEAGAEGERRLTAMRGGVDAQQAAFTGHIDAIEARIGGLRDSVTGLWSHLTETEALARTIGESTAPVLAEALGRVSEAADEAAIGARDALARVIPESAASLGAASREAMGAAVSEAVEARLAAIAEAADHAVAAVEAAAARLDAQIESVRATSTAVEARIAEARAETEATNQESFAREVSLLIESLNSTAIDVTKILSNDVTDTAWASYLKGDRGVFTRRAVRLIDGGEAREIAQHYDNDPEFHAHVNRYVHDFEAMLRRVLAMREGSPVAVTLLSSDNGKLYVALAQAIERLR